MKSSEICDVTESYLLLIYIDFYKTFPKTAKFCPRYYRLVGGGCFRIFSDPKEWESWGDANEICKSIDGELATPKRSSMLREYLKEKDLGNYLIFDLFLNNLILNCSYTTMHWVINLNSTM